MEVIAKLKAARVGPQKARLVANLVRGQNVNDAIRTLTFMKQKSALIIKKLIESAVANAEKKQVIDVDNLYVKSLMVDQGPGIYGFMPRAQGRATRTKKHLSHINLVLDER